MSLQLWMFKFHWVAITPPIARKQQGWQGLASSQAKADLGGQARLLSIRCQFCSATACAHKDHQVDI